MDQLKIALRLVAFISILLSHKTTNAQKSIGVRIGPHLGKFTDLDEKVKGYPSLGYNLFFNYYWREKREYIQIESGVTRYGVQTDYNSDRRNFSYVDEFGHQYFDVLRIRVGLYFSMYQSKNKSWNIFMGLGLFAGKMINSEADLTYVFSSPNRPEERIRESGAMNLEKLGFKEWIGGGDLDIDTGYYVNERSRIGVNARLNLGLIQTQDSNDLFVLNNILVGYSCTFNYQYYF